MDWLSEDPLEILRTTKKVVETATDVFIRPEKIAAAKEPILTRKARGFDSLETGFGSTETLENNIQLIFIENSVNFCFWPDKGRPKWTVVWNGAPAKGGWYGLAAAFKRALKEGCKLLDADYLASLSYEDAAHIFRGEDGVQLPLLQERVEHLQEAGNVLKEKYAGQFINTIEASGWDAIKLAENIFTDFSSFRDISIWNGNEIRFLKRAQITPNDITYALHGAGKKLSRIDELTAFADYKLPQVLREMGIVEYSPALAEKVDAEIELPHDSREEIEIRSATIWAIELLRQAIGTMTAGEIDNVIWLLSQDMQTESRPYHKTRTVYY
jgi:hypothetical protein